MKRTLEKHNYCPDFSNGFVDSTIPTISITTILSYLAEPFDQAGVAQNTYNKHFNNPDSQYYQKTVEQIIDMWAAKGAQSLHYGRLNDEYIGIILEGTEDDYEIFDIDNDVENDARLKAQVDAFDEFIRDNADTYSYVAREKTVFYRVGDYYVKGRFDALLYNKKTKKYVVVDWKTSGSVDTVPSRWTTKMLGACKHLDALNWNTYTLQVYFYKTALICSGYLPAGTTFDDIEVCIVNMPGKPFNDGKLYRMYNQAFDYSVDEMDRLYKWAIKKNEILSKRK